MMNSISDKNQEWTGYERAIAILDFFHLHHYETTKKLDWLYQGWLGPLDEY